MLDIRNIKTTRLYKFLKHKNTNLLLFEQLTIISTN